MRRELLIILTVFVFLTRPWFPLQEVPLDETEKKKLELLRAAAAQGASFDGAAAAAAATAATASAAPAAAVAAPAAAEVIAEVAGEVNEELVKLQEARLEADKVVADTAAALVQEQERLATAKADLGESEILFCSSLASPTLYPIHAYFWALLFHSASCGAKDTDGAAAAEEEAAQGAGTHAAVLCRRRAARPAGPREPAG